MQKNNTYKFTKLAPSAGEGIVNQTAKLNAKNVPLPSVGNTTSLLETSNNVLPNVAKMMNTRSTTKKAANIPLPSVGNTTSLLQKTEGATLMAQFVESMNKLKTFTPTELFDAAKVLLEEGTLTDYSEMAKFVETLNKYKTFTPETLFAVAKKLMESGTLSRYTGMANWLSDMEELKATNKTDILQNAARMFQRSGTLGRYTGLADFAMTMQKYADDGQTMRKLFNTSQAQNVVQQQNTKKMNSLRAPSNPNTNVQVTAEMKREADRLKLLREKNTSKEVYQQYEDNVKNYHDELMKMLDGQNKNGVVSRVNEMLSDSIFPNAEKGELAKVKSFMNEHEWASLDRVEDVVKNVYKQKLESIKKLMVQMKYSPERQQQVLTAISGIISQSVSTQIMTFQYIYAQYIMYKTIQSYVNLADSVEQAVNGAVLTMFQTDTIDMGLDRTQQKLFKSAVNTYYKELERTKKDIMAPLNGRK